MPLIWNRIQNSIRVPFLNFIILSYTEYFCDTFIGNPLLRTSLGQNTLLHSVCVCVCDCPGFVGGRRLSHSLARMFIPSKNESWMNVVYGPFQTVLRRFANLRSRLVFIYIDQSNHRRRIWCLYASIVSFRCAQHSTCWPCAIGPVYTRSEWTETVCVCVCVCLAHQIQEQLHSERKNWRELRNIERHNAAIRTMALSVCLFANGAHPIDMSPMWIFCYKCANATAYPISTIRCILQNRLTEEVLTGTDNILIL